MSAITSSCEQGPWAAHDSGPRPASAVGLVVVHSAETTSARSVARYFANPATEASTQLAVDGTRCVRMLSDLRIPWGAPGVNKRGLHVELCGRASWTREQWLAKPRLLDRGAYRVAKWCFRFDIPRRWVGVPELRANRNTVRGIITHADASRAFPDIGSGHWDPGAGFPYGHFLDLVRRHYEQIAGEWE